MAQKLDPLIEDQEKDVIKIFFNNSNLHTEIKSFDVSSNPDTNEGRFGIGPSGIILVRFNESGPGIIGNIQHIDFVGDVLQNLYGTQVTYGMGNYVTRNWSFKKTKDLTSILKSRLQYLETPEKKRKRPFSRGLYADTPHRILAVVESLNIYKKIWGEYEFYKQLKWS